MPMMMKITTVESFKSATQNSSSAYPRTPKRQIIVSRTRKTETQTAILTVQRFESVV